MSKVQFYFWGAVCLCADSNQGLPIFKSGIYFFKKSTTGTECMYKQIGVRVMQKSATAQDTF